MIKFQCPQGHPLSAPENLTGKAGKCPKCGTPFIIPSAEVAEAALAKESPTASTPAETAPAPEGAAAPLGDAAGSASGSSPANNPVAMGSGKGRSEDVFVFLCPNGHRLNGPPSLKGKPGRCPHCGATFRIPSDDDIDEEPVDGEPADDEEEDIPAGEMIREEFSFAGFGETDEVEEVEPEIDPPPPGPAALGYIVGRLWDTKTDNAELEIFLVEGEIMQPEFYSEILSSSDYAVFASQDGDDTYSLTVVPWSQVRKIGMRKIRELSPQMFR
jgi:hypothetical protein